MPHERIMLSNIDSKYMTCYSSQSAFDLSVDIPVGRPYGSTAILFKKPLESHTVTINSRLIAVTMKYDIGSSMFVSRLC
jgi:hypothetical protein